MSKGVESSCGGEGFTPRRRVLVGKAVPDAEDLPANNRSVSVIGRLVFGDDKGGSYQLPSYSAPSPLSARLRRACEPI